VDGLEPVPYPAALVIYLGYESGGSGGGGQKNPKGHYVTQLSMNRYLNQLGKISASFFSNIFS
jgi:hypothetical protein